VKITTRNDKSSKMGFIYLRIKGDKTVYIRKMKQFRVVRIY